jgi:serine/threonine-protein kinase
MYDFGFHGDGSAYIVMEMLEGETLERRLERLRRLELVDAVRVTRQIAGSLATAHAAGIIHRDLKPENIFIVRDPEALGGERPKVLDFGVAKLSGDLDRNQTMAGTMMGTPAYMSPEQCRGAGEVDARSDIYSLGCVLACLVTGRLPLDRHGVGELISAHMNDAPTRPSEILPDLPAELDDIVLRCLAKSPGDRFQTMGELQAACDALLAGLGSGDVPVAMGTLVMPLSAGFRSAVSGPDAPRIDTGELSRSASGPTPTTLSSAIGVTHPSARPRRRIGVWIGFGGTLVAAAIAAAIAMTGDGEPSRAPSPATAAAPVSPSVATPQPLDAPRSTSGSAIEADAGIAIGAAMVDAAVAPGADRPTRPAAVAPEAPDAKSRSKSRPRRHAPAHGDDLYDDR